MSVAMSVTYQGNLRCRAVHEPSGSAIETDAPLDNGGKGALFSPTDLVGAALGACMLTIMGKLAERRGISLEGADLRVEKAMVADPQRRIGTIAIRIAMPAGIDPALRPLFENGARSCPVFNSLDPRIEKTVSFEWR